MFFDKAAVLNAVKHKLSTEQKAQTKEINSALVLCLDDLSLRLTSDSFLTSNEEEVLAGEQNLEVSGTNLSLASIFALVISSGSTKRLLEFKDQKAFLRDYETDNSITAGIPEFYSILSADGGMPTLRFERALSADATVDVYHFRELTAANVSETRSMSPIVMGTLAYFFIGKDEGTMVEGRTFVTSKYKQFYRQYLELIPLMRSNDKFVDVKDTSWELNKLDKTTKVIQRGFRGRRN